VIQTNEHILKAVKTKNLKESCMAKQKIEFLTIELKEVKE